MVWYVTNWKLLEKEKPLFGGGWDVNQLKMKRGQENKKNIAEKMYNEERFNKECKSLS